MDSIVVFDMDGVLTEVSESYRAAIVETVEHFTGVRIERDLIQRYKNEGGWNNDWALSQGSPPIWDRKSLMATSQITSTGCFLGARATV